MMPDNPWSLVSGLAGICSVILCSQRKISTFFFGFIQITTYAYLCYLERFYAGIAMNVFYFGAQIYGIFQWSKRYENNQNESENGANVDMKLHTKGISLKIMSLICIFAAVLSFAVGLILKTYTNDTQPFLDAFTTVPAIIAQILMVTAYRENWYFWLFVDVLYVVMWGNAGNYCMLFLYIFWCANCIYAMWNWRDQK